MFYVLCHHEGTTGALTSVDIRPYDSKWEREFSLGPKPKNEV